MARNLPTSGRQARAHRDAAGLARNSRAAQARTAEPQTQEGDEMAVVQQPDRR